MTKTKTKKSSKPASRRKTTKPAAAKVAKKPKAAPVVDAAVPATWPATEAKSAKTPKARDPRIPAVGTVLTRAYKGKEFTVKVLEDGFAHDGKTWSSLSAIATALADGTPKNGILWFGLNGKPAKAAPAADAQEPAPEAEEPATRATRKGRTARAGRDPEPEAPVDAEPTEPVDAPAAE